MLTPSACRCRTRLNQMLVHNPFVPGVFLDRIDRAISSGRVDDANFLITEGGKAGVKKGLFLGVYGKDVEEAFANIPPDDDTYFGTI